MRAYSWLAVPAVSLLAVHAQGRSHGRHLEGDDGHGHGGAGAFEWAGIFEVPDAKYMWTAQKVEKDGVVDYADATMKIAALPATEATAAKLGTLKGEGEHSLEMECTVLEPGGVIEPKEDACYQLKFDADMWQSLYTVDASSVDAVAFFTEHVPTEFENTAHYLKDGSGEDVEPAAELPEEEEAKAEWGASIGAAILVNVVTLVGVIMIVPGLKTVLSNNKDLAEGILSSFAAGALLACAFFLLLFESTHLIGTGWEEEVEVLWRWGTMVLAGFFLPALVQSLTKIVVAGVSGGAVSPEQGAEDPKEFVTSPENKARVLGAVILGDFFHNLCDGFFIAAAFKGCGKSFGWGVVLATCLHEIPQELADYAVLTGSTVSMSPVMALLWNFLAGTSVILGVIIINAVEVDDSAVGLLLAFGGGVYVYLAASECMPKVHQLKMSVQGNLSCLLSFLVGAILIGLILLDHEHCVPGGGEHAH